MDDIGLQILRADMDADLNIAREALDAAADRFKTGGNAGTEAAAFQLARFYNVIEQMTRRVARAFENHIDAEEGWHVELIRRLSLEIPGVRPPLFSRGVARNLQQLRAFRHVINHGYDLAIDAGRLEPLMETARETLPGLLANRDEFLKKARGYLAPDS